MWGVHRCIGHVGDMAWHFLDDDVVVVLVVDGIVWWRAGGRRHRGCGVTCGRRALRRGGGRCRRRGVTWLLSMMWRWQWSWCGGRCRGVVLMMGTAGEEGGGGGKEGTAVTTVGRCFQIWAGTGRRAHGWDILILGAQLQKPPWLSQLERSVASLWAVVQFMPMAFFFLY